jgi:hypothetical protein
LHRDSRAVAHDNEPSGRKVRKLAMQGDLAELPEVGRLPMTRARAAAGTDIESEIRMRRQGYRDLDAAARRDGDPARRLEPAGGANISFRCATFTATSLPYQWPSPRRRESPPHPAASTSAPRKSPPAPWCRVIALLRSQRNRPQAAAVPLEHDPGFFSGVLAACREHRKTPRQQHSFPPTTASEHPRAP